MSTALAVAGVAAVGAAASGYMQAEGAKKAAKTAAKAQAASNPWANPYYQAQQAYKMATINEIFKRNKWEMPKFNPVYDNAGSVVAMTDAPKGVTFDQPNLTPAGQAGPNQWDPNAGKFIPYKAPAAEEAQPVQEVVPSEEPGTEESRLRKQNAEKGDEAGAVSLKDITKEYSNDEVPLNEGIILRNIVRGQFG